MNRSRSMYRSNFAELNNFLFCFGELLGSLMMPPQSWKTAKRLQNSYNFRLHRLAGS
jgi:hypothetical protein